MRISRPKLGKLNTGSASKGPFGHGRAQTANQVRSGHHHLSIAAGGATPGFGAGPQRKKAKRMF